MVNCLFKLAQEKVWLGELTPRGGGGWGGGTLIFSYIRRLGSFFWVQNFEFHFFGFFQKNEYFFWL